MRVKGGIPTAVAHLLQGRPPSNSVIRVSRVSRVVVQRAKRIRIVSWSKPNYTLRYQSALQMSSTDECKLKGGHPPAGN